MNNKPREVALQLLASMESTSLAEEVATRRESCARQNERKRFWYEVILQIHRLGRVRVVAP